MKVFGTFMKTWENQYLFGHFIKLGTEKKKMRHLSLKSTSHTLSLPELGLIFLKKTILNLMTKSWFKQCKSDLRRFGESFFSVQKQDSQL